MRNLLRRILFYIGAAWAAITLNFLLPRLAPGNPAELVVDKMMTSGFHPNPAFLASIEAQMGYNPKAPLWLQYLNYLNDLLHGNLGVSLSYSFTPVSQVISQDIWWTLGLGLVAVLLSFGIGTLLGIIVAWRRGGVADTILTPMMNFFGSVPYFWLALVFVWLFAFALHWFPPLDSWSMLDFNGPEFSLSFILDMLDHAILPALTIVLVSLGGWLLLARNVMITTLSEDYVLMARAKGLSNFRVMFIYAARNAILPNIAGFAMSLGFIVGGQVLTEMIFNYHGIGYALLVAIQQKDYALVQGIFLFISLGVLMANFLADLVYLWLDPRVRVERSA